jgi:uncharacterized protein YdeI (YjbR/CyaY-like superfamily)
LKSNGLIGNGLFQACPVCGRGLGYPSPQSKKKKTLPAIESLFISVYQYMNTMNPKVDAYVSKAEEWQKEVKKLRMIILDCGLTEELKWGKPCYTFQKSNIVIIIPLKEHCALMFCQGALLKDANGILTKPGENTQAGRWMKFASVREIIGMEPVLRAYIHEATAAEKAGLKVHFKRNPEPIPKEFQNKLAEIPALKTAFAALTPGRQRAYILYFSAAKQSKTRASRVEKCLPQILHGKGLNDDLRPASVLKKSRA